MFTVQKHQNILAVGKPSKSYLLDSKTTGMSRDAATFLFFDAGKRYSKTVGDKNLRALDEGCLWRSISFKPK